MTQVIELLTQWQALRKTLSTKRVGFVPTMGNLHAGHASLLTKAKAENDITVLSIFVNPTQFNDPSDYDRYPKTLEDDIKIAQLYNIDYVLLPTHAQIYPDNYAYKISENKLSTQMEGQSRPGHFDGVLTVVMKLLSLVNPQRAYFGEKDYQQLLLIQGMVSAFFLDIDIVPCPTIRDTDGLALSSRNRFLSTTERALAAQFPKILQSSADPSEIKNRLIQAGFEVLP
jgi:pantoate--beta-alanine ligase